jgi:hypothetical protein
MSPEEFQTWFLSSSEEQYNRWRKLYLRADKLSAQDKLAKNDDILGKVRDALNHARQHNLDRAANTMSPLSG